MTRQYIIWPLTYTPSPGPARLNADRTPSVIQSVILAYSDNGGEEVEVARLHTPGRCDPVTEIELLREAKQTAIAHLRNHPGPERLDITSDPPEIIDKLKRAEWTEYCREMGANS